MRNGIREFQPRQPLDRQLGATTLNQILRELESLRITRVVNGTFRKLPGGTEITVAPQRGGTSTPATRQPWDLIARVDPDANPEDENPPYLVRVQPGTLSEFLPTNWDEEFSVDANEQRYAVAEVSTDGKAITSVEIKLQSEPPSIQEPTLFALPSPIQILFGIFANGTTFRTIGNGNIVLEPKIWFREARTGVQPGESLFNLYYVLAP
jgi:hypothetical protein